MASKEGRGGGRGQGGGKRRRNYSAAAVKVGKPLDMIRLLDLSLSLLPVVSRGADNYIAERLFEKTAPHRRFS